MRIDRLVLRELFAPWLFGVGLFAALLMAGTYLGRLAGFLVDGVGGANVAKLFLLLLPSVLVKTFSMAVLLAALLGFGRLSSDSEIVALRAGGASIYRIVLPVALFSVGIAGLAFAFNELVVPRATATAKRLTEDLVKSQDVRANNPISRPLVEKGQLRAFLSARNVNPLSRALQGVVLVAVDEKGQESAVLFARELRFEGSELNLTGDAQWRIVDGRIITPDLREEVRVPGEMWPRAIPKVAATFTEIAAKRLDEFDAMTMAEIAAAVRRHRARGDWTPSDVANYEYGYWNKISVPLAAVVFGSLGAVLGIRNHRTGTATGFALAVAIIFGYVTLANFMNVWAMGGVIPAWAAAFAPLAIGGVASCIIMWRRNA